jgi:hypothetical protein
MIKARPKQKISTQILSQSLKRRKLRDFQTEKEIHRLRDRHWPANFSAKFCGKRAKSPKKITHIVNVDER